MKWYRVAILFGNRKEYEVGIFQGYKEAYSHLEYYAAIDTIEYAAIYEVSIFANNG